jgi:hypothetical protein
MANPTSNFGWQMPTSTDLVTDLPADFEVFGQAVDTDFDDLLGGANGYILSKASATDLDFAWIPNDQGDITAVNVTAPITGGGSAGAVTIGVSAASTSASGVVQLSDSTSTTSSVLASTPTATKSAYDLADAAIPKSTVTTAGDIIYRNATVPVRLGIGTAGQVLAVNSGATAPEWIAAPTGGGMTVIASGSLSSTSTLLSGIVGTYTDLVLEIRNYTTTVSGWAADIRLNDDATANRHFTTSGVPIGTGTAFNDTKILMTADNGNVSSSSSSLIRVTIPSYANTLTWKLVECLSVTQVTANPANFYFQDGGGIYNQTAAISSLRILPNSAATIGGTYILYGVK